MALASGLFVLAGCTPGPIRPPPATVSLSGPAALQNWTLDGRIAVRGRDDAWQANLFWDHDPHQDRIRLSGPLSQGVVSVILQNNLIYINEGEGRAQLSKDPDAALREKLGFAVPFRSLRYWILGIPDPSQPVETLKPADGAAQAFRQGDWTVQVDRRIEAAGHQLPQKLLTQGLGFSLKLIVDQWETPR